MFDWIDQLSEQTQVTIIFGSIAVGLIAVAWATSSKNTLISAITLSFWVVASFAFCFGSFAAAYEGENGAGFIWASGAGLVSYYLFIMAREKWKEYFAWKQDANVRNRPGAPPTL